MYDVCMNVYEISGIRDVYMRVFMYQNSGSQDGTSLVMCVYIYIYICIYIHQIAYVLGNHCTYIWMCVAYMRSFGIDMYVYVSVRKAYIVFMMSRHAICTGHVHKCAHACSNIHVNICAPHRH